MSSPQNTFEPYTASKNTPILSKATQQFGQYYHTPPKKEFLKKLQLQQKPNFIMCCFSLWIDPKSVLDKMKVCQRLLNPISHGGGGLKDPQLTLFAIAHFFE